MQRGMGADAIRIPEESGFIMDNHIYQNTLLRELVPALGCTEPIALAYAASTARQVLGCFPERVQVSCSGNIIKNVRAVVVPNSGGMKGIDAAVTLGIVGGDPARKLEVLCSVTAQHIQRTRELLKTDFCTCTLTEKSSKLYIQIRAYNEGHCAEVVIRNHHTNITYIEKDGKVLLKDDGDSESPREDCGDMTIKGILDFASSVPIDDVREILDRQISNNAAISREGRTGKYGIQVWRSVEAVAGTNMYAKAVADAAAASEARMCGCPLPVVINSGSGNQGITVSVPVVSIAKSLAVPEERLYRALVVSNLVSIHLKSYIGDLSAFCGAVTAACGAGAAAAFLMDAKYAVITATISNTLASVSGILCDGAKASCASKVAASLQAAFSGLMMAQEGGAFEAGDGLVMQDIETTIQCIGHIGRCGMEAADREILTMMLHSGKQPPVQVSSETTAEGTEMRKEYANI